MGKDAGGRLPERSCWEDAAGRKLPGGRRKRPPRRAPYGGAPAVAKTNLHAAIFRQSLKLMCPLFAKQSPQISCEDQWGRPTSLAMNSKSPLANNTTALKGLPVSSTSNVGAPNYRCPKFRRHLVVFWVPFGCHPGPAAPDGGKKATARQPNDDEIWGTDSLGHRWWT